METVPEKSRLSSLLRWCEAQGASDLHARGGSPFIVRIHGRLSTVPPELYPAPEDLTLTS